MLALRFLPHLPPEYLIQLLEKGEWAGVGFAGVGAGRRGGGGGVGREGVGCSMVGSSSSSHCCKHAALAAALALSAASRCCLVRLFWTITATSHAQLASIGPIATFGVLV